MIIIAAGSNLSFCGRPPAELVTSALASLGTLGEGLAMSPLYDSPAWPDPAEPAYVNAVAILQDSALGPAAMLAALHALEDGFGRERAYLQDPALRYAPRTLDLDLVAHHETVCGNPQEGGPILPHPGLAERDFVLAPLCDLAPGWRDPRSGVTAAEMLARIAPVTARRRPAQAASK